MVSDITQTSHEIYINEYKGVINNRIPPYNKLLPDFNEKYEHIICSKYLIPDIFSYFGLDLYSFLKTYDYNLIDIYSFPIPNCEDNQTICRLVHTEKYGLAIKINFKEKLKQSNIILQKCISKLLLKSNSNDILNFSNLLHILYNHISLYNYDPTEKIDTIKNKNQHLTYSLHLLFYNIISTFFKALNINKKKIKLVGEIINQIFTYHCRLEEFLKKYTIVYDRINMSTKFNPYKNKNIVDCIINCKNILYSKYYCLFLENEIEINRNYNYNYYHENILNELTIELSTKYNLNDFNLADINGFTKFIYNRNYANLANMLYTYNIKKFENCKKLGNVKELSKNIYTYSYIYFYFVCFQQPSIYIHKMNECCNKSIQCSNKIEIYQLLKICNNISTDCIIFYAIFNKLLNTSNQKFSNISMLVPEYLNNKYDKLKYFTDGINSKFVNKLLLKYYKLIKYVTDHHTNSDDLFNIYNSYISFFKHTNYIIHANFNILPKDSLSNNRIYKKINNYILYINNYNDTIEYKTHINALSSFDYSIFNHILHQDNLKNKIYYNINDIRQYDSKINMWEKYKCKLTRNVYNYRYYYLIILIIFLYIFVYL